MRDYRDIFEYIYDILLQDDTIPTYPDDHLQHVLELGVFYLSHIVKNMIVDRATNRMRKMINFSLASIMFRHKAQGRGDKRHG